MDAEFRLALSLNTSQPIIPVTSESDWLAMITNQESRGDSQSDRYEA